MSEFDSKPIDIADDMPVFSEPKMAPQAIEHKLFCLAKRALLAIDASGAGAIQAAALDTIIVEELERQIISVRSFYSNGCCTQSLNFLSAEQVRRY